MAILVKSPITSNGRDPILVDGKVTYKETILEDAARSDIEKQNKFRPTHLKKVIEDIKEPKPKKDENK